MGGDKAGKRKDVVCGKRELRVDEGRCGKWRFTQRSSCDWGRLERLVVFFNLLGGVKQGKQGKQQATRNKEARRDEAAKLLGGGPLA